MYDRFNRKINYLRISVTDRCNLRCIYCMPAEGIKLLRHEDILTFDEITEMVTAAISLGIDKFRLTGGEPLVRKGITELVRMISSVPGIKDLSMTTNGTLLEEFAGELQNAGLQRVNISLDTVDPARFSRLTRGGDLAKVYKGIEAARKSGLHPIKINCVVLNSSTGEDAIAMKKYGEENGFQVRFIHQMNLAKGKFSIVEGGDGGNCSICNRLRLTSNGYVKPCLFNALGFFVRELGPYEALRLAIENKPEYGTYNNSEQFYNIGG
jgi:cyclic pyranopterin phosphate synthase